MLAKKIIKSPSSRAEVWSQKRRALHTEVYIRGPTSSLCKIVQSGQDPRQRLGKYVLFRILRVSTFCSRVVWRPNCAATEQIVYSNFSYVFLRQNVPRRVRIQDQMKTHEPSSVSLRRPLHIHAPPHSLARSCIHNRINSECSEMIFSSGSCTCTISCQGLI